MRRFWKGDTYQIPDLASRLSGSSDIFNHDNRTITSSVNFITAHDGFCLHDLVSYNVKHNLSNGEDNRDGNNSNWSWNSGLEGETQSPDILANRRLRAKAMLASLMLSFGVPMILAGDELGDTRFGNNNPYCQDNVISWMVWEAVLGRDIDLARFARRVIRLRRRLKIFNRLRFFEGRPLNRRKIKDLTWYTDKGLEFSSADWDDHNRRSLAYAVYNNGHLVFCILNAEAREISWRLPTLDGKNWNLLLDSSNAFDPDTKLGPQQIINVPAWSVLVFEIKKK